MAKTLASSVTAQFNTNYVDGTDLQNTVQNAITTFSKSLTTGTGSDKADLAFLDTESLAGSGNKQYDLAGGVTDAFGQTLTFVAVKGFIVKNTSTTAAVLDIGGGTDGIGGSAFVNWVGDATDKVTIRAGGVFMIFSPDATGYQVTAGTGDILRIEETAALAATFDIVIIGATA